MDNKSEWNLRTSFSPGTLIAGRYEIRQKLGAGGMGVVLKANDQKLNGEEVALKLLKPQHEDEDPMALPRLINEVRLARSLTHPNIVRIHDISETEDGTAYVSMEFIEGTSLADVITKSNKQGLPFAEAYRIISEIVKGVAFAHGKGIIHRDLKPANILISKTGEIKIADFGIARSIESDIALTRTGEAVGTPAYMAPEQFRGEKLDARCDVYALGILAHQLITGELPFSSKSFFNIALQHMNEELPTFESCGKQVPEWFDAIVMTAAAKDRQYRYASAAEMSKALEQCSSKLPKKFIPKSKGAWAAGLGVATCLAAIGIVNLEMSEGKISPATEINKPVVEARLLSENSAPAEDFRSSAVNEIKEFAIQDAAQQKETLPVSSGQQKLEPQKLPEEETVAVSPETAKKEMQKEVPQEVHLARRSIIEELKRRSENDFPDNPLLRKAKEELSRPNELVARRGLAKNSPGLGQDLLQGTRSLYSGQMMLPGKKDGRSLSLDLSIGQGEVTGTAKIDGYSKSFNVSGRRSITGFDLVLSNKSLEIILTGVRRKDVVSRNF